MAEQQQFQIHIDGSATRLSNSQLSHVRKEFPDLSMSDADLRKLFRKFKKLDTDQSGSLSVSEFLAVPELEHNPLVRRIISVVDSDHNGEVDFEEFVAALSVLTNPTEQNQDRLKFTFRVYDCDGDGFISNADLFHVLKTMVGANLSDVQLQQLVDRSIVSESLPSPVSTHPSMQQLQADKDRDGRLSFDEFVGIVSDTNISDKLKINLH